MMGLTNNLAFSLFVPQASSLRLWLYIGAALLVGIGFLFALTLVPNRLRKPIVMGMTFAAGWFYFLEFFMPGSSMVAPVRDQLSVSANYLSSAQQDLYAVEVHNGNPETRINRALRELDSTVVVLGQAQSKIKGLVPVAQSQFDKAASDSNQWAKDNGVDQSANDDGVKTKLLQRDADHNNAIMDLRTQKMSKRISDLDNAGNKIALVMGQVEQARSSLRGVGADTTKARALLATAEDNTILARTMLSDNSLTPYTQPVGDLIAVVGAFALGLGIYSLMSLHGKSILKRRPGWINSLAFYVALVSITAVAFMQAYVPKGSIQSLSDSLYDIMFRGALTSLSATMFSLVAFYIVSAAYRAFRIKSGESALMMVAAFLVMLGIVPFGVFITSKLPMWASSFRLENIQHWIMLYPNAAAQRGIAFGIGVGGLAMALRLWLSLERGSYFDKQM
jgi:hypothetical protein